MTQPTILSVYILYGWHNVHFSRRECNGVSSKREFSDWTETNITGSAKTGDINILKVDLSDITTEMRVQRSILAIHIP